MGNRIKDPLNVLAAILIGLTASVAFCAIVRLAIQIVRHWL